MCGEHFIISARGLGKTGSSPHVRGAPERFEAFARAVGIIPACAGSTTSIGHNWTGMWDHPRMCGEHVVLPPFFWTVSGSSPHVRGARSAWVIGAVFAGIIPACAGSTSPWPSASARCGDHPRMCGEHDPPCWSLHVFQGSSPHVRGAPKGRSGSKDGTGIIPACAGSTP